MLERRVSLLGVLSAALDQRDLYVRIGARERGARAARAVARRRQLRPAAAQPRHGVGDRADADGLRDGDRRRARRRRCSSRASSKTSTTPAERHATRLLRGARRRPGARTRPRSRRRSGGSRASCTRTQHRRPAGRGQVQGGRRGLRGALGRRPPPPVRRLRARGPAQRRLRARTSRASARSPTCSPPSSARRLRRRVRRRPRPARRRRCRAPTSSSRSRSTSPRPRAARRSRSPTRPTCAASTATATAPSPARRSSRARAATARASSRRSRAPRFGQLVRTAVCDVCGGDGRVPEQPCARCARRRARVREPRTLHVDVPAGIADGQRIRLSGRGHAGERGGPERRPLRRRPRARGRALRARRRGPAHGHRRRRRRWPRSARPSRCRGSTATSPVEVPAGTQPGEVITLRARGMPPLQPRAHRRPARARQRRDPAQAQPRAARPARAARRTR